MNPQSFNEDIQMAMVQERKKRAKQLAQHVLNQQMMKMGINPMMFQKGKGQQQIGQRPMGAY